MASRHVFMAHARMAQCVFVEMKAPDAETIKGSGRL
jgi:hypothetical protein